MGDATAPKTSHKVAVQPSRAATTRVIPTSTNDGSTATSPPPEAGLRRYHPGKIDIFFMGISIVMCGQYMSWNIGLAAGLYSYLICVVVMALAYIAFCCCVAEVTGALPFAGGSYGLARCTLGFFPAFLIGCAEALEYIASVAVVAICVANIIVQAAPSMEPYRPLLWFVVFYLPATVIQCIGGAPFWLFSTGISIFQTVLLLVYCFGVLGDTDYATNAVGDPSQLYINGAHGFLAVFPFAAWFFLGVEALNLASDDVKVPKTTIPIAQIACILTLVFTGFFVLLTTVSLPTEGGIPALTAALAPLDNGFMRLFGIDPALVTLLSLPSQYAGAYGFSWASAKLVHALGESRLLPPWLATTSSRFHTPYVAIVTISVLGYCICLLIHYVPSVAGYLLPLCLLFAFASYSGQCVGYISLRLNYPVTKQSAFKNPFGIVGAAFALVVWLVAIVGIVGFQGRHGAELVLFCALLVVLGVYYVLVAKRRQIMSEEESKVLLVAHIMRFNSKKRHRYTPGRSTGTSSPFSAKGVSKPSKGHTSSRHTTTERQQPR